MLNIDLSRDHRIDWGKPQGEIYNLIKVLSHPHLGAYTFCEGKKVHIWKAKLCDTDEVEEFNAGGLMLGKTDDGIIVSAGTGHLEIKRLQFEGEEELNAAEAAAAGKIKLGQKFS